jgi:hypothetical protein
MAELEIRGAGAIDKSKQTQAGAAVKDVRRKSVKS